MVRIQKSRKKLQAEVDDFNFKFPVGTAVQYWTGIREGEGKKGLTRSVAELFQGHTPVVWIDGCSGCVALSHVLPCVGPEDPEELTPDMKFREQVIRTFTAFNNHRKNLRDLRPHFWVSLNDLLWMADTGTAEELRTEFLKQYKILGAPGDFGYGTPCGDALKDLYQAWNEFLKSTAALQTT